MLVDPSLSSATESQAPAVTRPSAASFYIRGQQTTFREVNSVRNVIRLVIVLSAIAGLLVVQGMGPKPSVLSSPR
jgi:hypothetical protein